MENLLGATTEPKQPPIDNNVVVDSQSYPSSSELDEVQY